MAPSRLPSSLDNSMTPTTTFDTMAQEFQRFHKQPLNVLMHLITTPVGITAALALVHALVPLALPLPLILVLAYCAVLTGEMQEWLWISNAVVMLVAAFVSVWVDASVPLLCIVMCSCYLMQDLSHWITNEPTYQSTYLDHEISDTKQPISALAAALKFLTHTFLLLPLCLDAAVSINLVEKIMSWCTIRNFIVVTKLDSKQEVEDAANISSWILSQSLQDDLTAHWWQKNLKGGVREAFDRLSSSSTVLASFKDLFIDSVFTVEPLEEMNEIYVAAIQGKRYNSDNVFYTKHVDGPWMMFPFVSVYRGILGVNQNRQIETHFPVPPMSLVVGQGDFCAFDFNREIHLIRTRDGFVNQNRRHTLKLHFLIYPTSLKWYGKFVGFLTVNYDIIARKLFLATIEPKTAMQKFLYGIVMLGTHTVFRALMYCGGATVISYVLSLLLLHFTLFPSGYPVFLVATSFVHYAIYISTYYLRDSQTSFGGFKHTVIALKALALAQIFFIYCKNFQWDSASLAMIFAGFGLSGSAALALGVDKTYFGMELGLVKFGLVHSFPYSLRIPHPMILGSLIALIGIHKMESFRNVYPWLVPVHMFLYFIHMMQEHFDIHKSSPANVEKHLPSPTAAHDVIVGSQMKEE